MNTDKASDFINSLVRNLQVLCHSNVEFSDNVEVIGHIYLSVDRNKKFNYIVNEKVCKNDNSSTVFVSNSFHAEDKKKNDEKNNEKQSKNDKSEQFQEQERSQHQRSHNQQPSHSKRSNHQHDSPNTNSSQRQKRSFNFDSRNNRPVSNDNKKPRTIQSERDPPPQIKQEAVSIDLTNIKEEPSEHHDIKSMSFGDINNTSWSEQQSQQSASSQRYGNDSAEALPISFGVENENYGIYPVAMYDSNLETLSSQASTSHDQQLLQNLSAVANQNTSTAMRLQLEDILSTRKELTLENKIRIIQATSAPGVKISQYALATQFGVSQPAICYILKKKDTFIKEYERKYGRKPEGIS